MKATLVDSPPDGDDWLHEIKYDGYRTQLIAREGDAQAFTNRGHDWSHLYAAVLAELPALDRSALILDGEIIVQDAAGRSDYHALRAQLARRRPSGLVFMAFDLLHLDGRDLRREPVEERRARLSDLLGENQAGSAIQYSAHIVGGGGRFFDAATRMGLEGIVSKKLGSRYRSGRSRSWLKTKTFVTSEFVVIGTSPGDRAPVALLARETEDHRLEYVGAAMVTMEEDQRELFWRANERLKIDRPALHMDPRPETGWLRPEMRVLVQHLSGEEPLRHATVKRITHLPAEPKAGPAERAARPRAEPRREPALMAPKGAVPPRETLLAYYRELGPLMLPHVGRRALNLLRCHGRHCQFQRNRRHPATDQRFDEPIHKIPVQQKNGKVEDYLWIDDMAGLLACVEVETLEFHAWGSRIEDIERPDRIAFDLDPGEGVGFEAVKAAALQLRRSLAAIGLESWPLLTGGKGVHVVLPFRPEGDWDAVRGFARSFCAAMADAAPHLYTIALPKAQRKGRIFLDYLRNQRTATAIQPYSVRVRAGMPVAAPVAWDELAEIESATRFSIADAALLKRRARSRALKGWGASDQPMPSI